MSIFNELKRRNVLRVGAAYIVASWLVVQVVETVLPAFGFGDHAIRVAVIVLTIGFIPALIFAWAFELTPEGLKKESEVDRSRSITPQTGKKLDRVIMVVLAVALVFFAFDRFVLSESRESDIAEQARQQGRTEALVENYGDHSIAVLPFVDMSPEGDQEYFSDGIAEELLNLLARIPELRVISRSSAFSYKGKDFKLSDVARELNVAHILEGSVRKAGNTVRITAQLIEARSDTHLWSETYDRSLDDIFAVQDEISAVVVEQLKVRILGDAPSALETDAAAYAAFLQARHLRRQNSGDSLGQSQELLEQVLDIDPNYLPAIDDLITVYINQAHTGTRPFDAGYELARELTLRGLDIDPGFARFYIQLGWIEMFYGRDMLAAAKAYERGLAIDSTNTTSLGDTASFLNVLGRPDDSIRVHEYTNKRDPFHPVGTANLGFALLSAGRYEEAARAFEQALELSSGYEGGQFYLAEALLLAGNPESALQAVQKESSEAFRLTGLAIAHQALGNGQASDAALESLIAEYSADRTSQIAQVHAYRGESNAAFEWLGKMAEQGHPELVETHGLPLYRNLHGDPRWSEFLEKTGQSPEDLAGIPFEFSLPD